MRLRNNNFAAAFDEMKRRSIVKTQKELAHKMGVSEDTITRILKYRTEVTDDVITKLQTASGCIFNLQWLRGESDKMFLDTSEKNPQPSAPIDADFYHDALKLNAKVIEDMRKDLEYFKSLVLDKDSTIQENHEQVITMRTQLVSLQTELDHIKNTLSAVRKNYDRQVADIAQRDATIKLLQAQLARYSSGTSFPQGVADDRSPITPDK